MNVNIQLLKLKIKEIFDYYRREWYYLELEPWTPKIRFTYLNNEKRIYEIFKDDKWRSVKKSQIYKLLKEDSFKSIFYSKGKCIFCNEFKQKCFHVTVNFNFKLEPVYQIACQECMEKKWKPFLLPQIRKTKLWIYRLETINFDCCLHCISFIQDNKESYCEKIKLEDGSSKKVLESEEPCEFYYIKEDKVTEIKKAIEYKKKKVRRV